MRLSKVGQPAGFSSISRQWSSAEHENKLGTTVFAAVVLLAVIVSGITAVRSWSADLPLKLQGGKGLLRAFSLMPEVLGFACWMSWYAYFSGDPFSAFVESMMSCPVPRPVGVACPTGSVFRGGTCVAEARGAAEWSLSPHCADKKLVLGRASKLNGINNSVASAVGLVSVVAGGWYMDHRGRRPVLLSFLFANVLVKALLFISCFLLRWDVFVAVIVMQNVVEVMTASPVYPALNCIINDLAGGDTALLNGGYAALEVVKNFATVLALLSGYPILKVHLTSYASFWGALTVVSVLANIFFRWFLPQLFLRETLKSSAEAAKSDELVPIAGADRSGFLDSVLGGLRLCCNDTWLLQYLLLWAMVTLATSSAWDLAPMFLQALLGAEQANASLCRVCWHVALMLGASLSTVLIRHCGVRGAYAVSLSTMAVSWGLCGLCGACPSMARPLFWGCGVCLGGLAYGLLTPCSGAIIGSRVPSNLQGQTFALSVVAGTAVGIPLGPLWSQVFFDPAALGWRAGLMWFVSAALLWLALAWFILLCRRP